MSDTGVYIKVLVRIRATWGSQESDWQAVLSSSLVSRGLPGPWFLQVLPVQTPRLPRELAPRGVTPAPALRGIPCMLLPIWKFLIMSSLTWKSDGDSGACTRAEGMCQLQWVPTGVDPVLRAGQAACVLTVHWDPQLCGCTDNNLPLPQPRPVTQSPSQLVNLISSFMLMQRTRTKVSVQGHV